MFKDMFKENGKILLLALGLLVAATIAMISVKTGGYTNNISNSGEKQTYTNYVPSIEDGVDYQAKIKTSYGDITIDLFEQETPITVNSFLFLAGEEFYNNLTFHRVVQNFVIQAGDPNGDGTGGPGYTFVNEITDREYEAYSVGMANAGANTNGSQFFIVSANISQDNIDVLNGNYTIFGEVISGFAVVDSIERASVDAEDKPTNDITIESIQILEM
jgi:cyclophilin family peptidyl-prolyl cis-trans isomerase